MTDWTPCRETDVRHLQELVDAGNANQDRLWAHIDVLRVQLEDRRAEVDRLTAMVQATHVHEWEADCRNADGSAWAKCRDKWCPALFQFWGPIAWEAADADA